jgi:Co/Zn/Cd efflux system component
MSMVGVLALAANLFCLILLSRHRGDDINMRSAWVCSRNDVIGNVGVLLAAVAVALTDSPWPDILIGLIVAWIFTCSSVRVIRDARHAAAISHFDATDQFLTCVEASGTVCVRCAYRSVLPYQSRMAASARP